MTRHVQQIGFGEDQQGPLVEIAYFDTDNIRAGGHLKLMTHLQLSLEHPDYREDAEELMRVAQRMLDNALEDYEDSEPYVEPREESDEEGLGMGHGDRS